jgi:hypothetical protein
LILSEGRPNTERWDKIKNGSRKSEQKEQNEDPTGVGGNKNRKNKKKKKRKGKKAFLGMEATELV